MQRNLFTTSIDTTTNKAKYETDNFKNVQMKTTQKLVLFPNIDVGDCSQIQIVQYQKVHVTKLINQIIAKEIIKSSHNIFQTRNNYVTTNTYTHIQIKNPNFIR